MTACQSSRKELKVLQFNIWQEGTSVENGYWGIVDNIVELSPDLITFSEVRNYNGISFISRLVTDLEKRGMRYYGKESVSTEIVLYSAHLDWMNCSYYLPRGYDGCTWKKMKQPVVDVDSILADNKASFRDDEVRAIVEDARKEREHGRIVMIGGDFNEPSHLDWQADTKDIREHRGMVVNWDCSKILIEDGYKDTFREIYPNPVIYPGFTFPTNNIEVDLKKLTWAPEADDRERIDFIYYYPNKAVALKDVRIVGAEGAILYGERIERDKDSQDSFIAPAGTWPSDHKALLATFVLK